MNETKKAILVVSFGTSVNETRTVTIEAIEQDIQAAFPEYRVYRAWTSKMIIRKLWNRDQIKINTVTEAMQQMKQDGITEIIVQPTHVINGIENDCMKEEIMAFSGQFTDIHFGTPLLTTTDDSLQAVQAIAKEYAQLEKDEALVLMGHGTTHYANAIYAALNYTFKEQGHANIFLGTVEAYPALENLIREVKNTGYKKVTLAPFMIVAGDHARNDMAGEEEDSWVNQFKAEGFEVTPVIKGLGEYPSIRNMFIAHIKATLQE